MFKMKQIIFALCAVMLVNAVFAAASDPSGLTLVDLTSPDGEVTSSRAFDGANDTPPSSAFNDTEGNRFLISGIGGDSGPVDLVYSFDTPVNITSYSIKNYHEMKMDSRAPKSWTFYGSNDEGATWVPLDTQTEEMNWTANEFRFYYFGDKGAFSRYKIEFTANNGDEYLQFARLEFYDVKLEDAVPIEFGEVQSSSDYTSWSVVQRYNLREEAAPLENSDVVILIGDSPETLAESNIVPTIDENGISFGMTDCPNGKTYYWQVKCNVNGVYKNQNTCNIHSRQNQFFELRKLGYWCSAE